MGSMEYDFKGKRALITGGASGIGKGIAMALFEKGVKVAVLDANEESLESLHRAFPEIETRTVDLRNWKLTQDAVKSVLPIDFLVNNAGTNMPTPITDITEEKLNNIFDVNIKAYFNVTQIVVDNLLRNELPGSIVNISSIVTHVPIPMSTMYTSSKHAVDGFTKALALELGPNNIRVNSVNPALVKTPQTHDLWENPEMLHAVMRRLPLQRVVEVEDVVEAVIFLLSDKSQMITGTCLKVDGGHAISF